MCNVSDFGLGLHDLGSTSSFGAKACLPMPTAGGPWNSCFQGFKGLWLVVYGEFLVVGPMSNTGLRI